MGNPVLPLPQITHVCNCGVDGKRSPSPASDNPCLQLWGIRGTQSFLCSRQPMFATVGWMGNPVLPLLQTTHVCNCGWMGNPVLPLIQTTHVCNCGRMGKLVAPLLKITHVCNCGWMGNPVLPLLQTTHVCNCGVDGKPSLSLLQTTHVCNCGVYGEPSPSSAPDNPCLQLWGGWGTQSFPCSRQPIFLAVGWTGNPVLPLLQTTHVCNCGVYGEPSPSSVPDNPCLQLWGGWGTQSFPCSRQPMFATVG